MLKIFPLLIIPIAVYNILAFTAGGQTLDAETGQMINNAAIFMQKPLLSMGLISGANWVMARGDLIVIFGLVFLFLEIVRSTRSDATSIVNHGLSMAVLLFCLIEFIVLPGFATSTFFFLTMMALLDVVAGFTISITSARRDFGAFPGA